MMATTFPSLNACSFVPLPQVQTWLGLPVLHEPKLSFGDMTDHGVLHRVIASLRSRLHDDVTHRDTLEAGDDGGSFAIGMLHDPGGERCVLAGARVHGLRRGGLHHSSCRSDHAEYQSRSTIQFVHRGPPGSSREPLAVGMVSLPRRLPVGGWTGRTTIRIVHPLGGLNTRGKSN